MPAGGTRGASMENIQRKLTQLRGAIERVVTYSQQVRDGEITPDIYDLPNRKAKLQADYQTYLCTLELLSGDTDVDEDVAVTEARYFTGLAIIDSTLASLTRNDIPPNQNQPNSSSSSKCSTLRLPNVTIPKFSGRSAEWTPFFDLFSALIDQDSNLSPVQKLYYLRAYLEEEPLHLIENLLVVHDSYPIALKILKDRYFNKPSIVNAHLKSLIELQPINKPSSESLRRFSVTIKQSFNALKALGVPVEHWDIILVYLLTSKLDFNTHRAFELERDSTNFATLIQLLEFVDKRALALENVASPAPSNKPKVNYLVNNTGKRNYDTRADSSSRSSTSLRCLICDKPGHKIYTCNNFRQMAVPERRAIVNEKRLCYNCFSNQHLIVQCSSTVVCQICNKRHHTMLHIDAVKSDNNICVSTNLLNPNASSFDHAGCDQRDVASTSTKRDTSAVTSSSYHSAEDDCLVLLATARVSVATSLATDLNCRILLDSASQTNFVTSDFVRRAGLKTYRKNRDIHGLGEKATFISEFVSITMKSLRCQFRLTIECAVMDRITSTLPQHFVDTKAFQLPAHIQLADPTFHAPSAVDVLVGADVFYAVIGQGLIRLGPQLPTLQNTKFGWVVAGIAPLEAYSGRSRKSLSHVTCCTAVDESHETDNLLSRFWAIEETCSTPKVGDMQAADADSDKALLSSLIFNRGRFQVDILFKSDAMTEQLGNSYLIAVKGFRWLERSLHKQPEVFKMYKEFIDEYLALDHASHIDFKYNPLQGADANGYFLPHHPVIKQSSSTTKLRVVFDASARTTTGLSLNDTQHIGVPVQSNLFQILVRFRLYRYAVFTDIEKMYRQISVSPNHCKFQRIVWRDHPQLPLQHIELRRVTYGISSAPYTATRILEFIASTECDDFPMVAKILRQCTYIDDVIFGHDDLSVTLATQNQLVNVLQKYGFALHKWCANHPTLLSKLPPQQLEMVKIQLTNDHYCTKTLGLSWDPTLDRFMIEVPTHTDLFKKFTKRSVLSYIAKFFDPLGFISPVVIKAKLKMQQIWLGKYDWDDSLPSEILKDWVTFTQRIPELATITINRWMFQDKPKLRTELHGFCDASLDAYGACLYMRCIYVDRTTTVNLLCSKSRVAPVRRLTIPRLELQAALILSRLVYSCYQLMELEIHGVYLWSDSEITLAWIKSASQRLKPVILSRVNEIRELTRSFNWRHIQSRLNPSDLISRGVDPGLLQTCLPWWNGPTFLASADFQVRSSGENTPEAALFNEIKSACVAREMDWLLEGAWDELIHKFSKLNKLARVLAYVFRFVHNAAAINSKLGGVLSLKELHDARLFAIKVVQHRSFSEEIKRLQHDDTIGTSPLKPLYPFVDKFTMIRVGGRLENADVPFETKHPLILPAHHHLTDLIVRSEHEKLLHASASVTLVTLRQEYWPLGGKREIKRILKSCVLCYKLRAKASTQLMGSLPPERVIANRPFTHVGVDFAGPVQVRQSRLRRAITTKGYIAVFVCMATRCLHLELISNLSTENFLLGLNRFISRRGLPTTISCDNATNFRGAANKLQELYQLFCDQNCQEDIQTFAVKNRIEFKFIPPLSPNFGGIWEASVKSTKAYLYKILQDVRLTFEELTTVLAQIEALLNSRPIAPMSDDPNDLNFLTPGHFLVHTNLVSYPQPIELRVPVNRLSFWRHCQRLSDDFWRRWHKDVLNTYQQRPKWLERKRNLTVGDLVLLREPNSLPFHWKMARVVETFPGRDGLVRTAKVRSTDGEYIRSLSRICPLPC